MSLDVLLMLCVNAAKRVKDGRRGSKGSQLYFRGYTEEKEKQRSMGLEEKRPAPAEKFSIQEDQGLHQKARGFHFGISQQGNTFHHVIFSL